MNKRHFLFKYLLVCSFLFTNFLIKGSQSNNSSLDTVTLQLKWKHQFQFAGYYAAQEKGFYKDAGLYVIIKEANVFNESTQIVSESKADFGIAGTDLLILRDKGEPLIALAAIFQHSPIALISRKNSGINNIADLKGKRVMLESHAYELLIYLKKEGLSKDDLVLYPPTYNVDMFLNNEVDAISAYLTDEIFLLNEKKVDYQVFLPTSAGIDFYSDILFTTENQLKNNPERVRAFLEASLKGWNYSFQNIEEISDLILMNYSKRHTREHLIFEANQMKEYAIPTIVEIGYMYNGRWDHISECYQTLGLISQDFILGNFIYIDSKEDKSNIFKVILVGGLTIVGLLILFALFHLFRKVVLHFKI